ncbi:MAG TPA: hypothetical protein VFF31_06165 [Blastocatellia bacterium]|nr:hypothetical protein [Blastocatellia bacterium]
MAARKDAILSFSLAVIGLLMLMVPSNMAAPEPVAKNSWRGITPLRSSVEDVARAIGAELESTNEMLSGPYKVDGGEVTFSYLTPSIAKIYRAPRSMVGKVFTIYFKPVEPMSRADLSLGTGFKRCVEQNDRSIYYFVSDSGVAYRLLRASDRVETVIYQPSRVEVQNLAVNTECVF